MRRALLIVVLLAGCRHSNQGKQLDLSVPDMGRDGFIAPEDDLAGVEAAVCGALARQAESIGVDLFFALDTSFSMDFNLKWVSVAQALKLFLGNPRLGGVGVGLQYYPLRTACDVSGYASPAVPIGLLPTASSTLVTSIDAQSPAGGTAIVPAMNGILQYATMRAAADRNRKLVVVLATDGVPDATCVPSDDGGQPDVIQVTADLVRAAATADPPVLTFVIGVGSELTALNTIAAAGGGSPTAFLVDTTQNIEQAFLSALDIIRRKALVCEFEIPPTEPGLTVDYSKVNIRFRTPAGDRTFAHVAGRNGCATAPNNGWFYDDENTPRKIVLCEDLCDQVRSADVGQVDILFGCQSIIP